jgi:hypothetical protein
MGFYLVKVRFPRTADNRNYGRGAHSIRGAVDMGGNPGSMLVNFCVELSLIQPKLEFPDGPKLTCASDQFKGSRRTDGFSVPLRKTENGAP